jgi:hypothetical protein
MEDSTAARSISTGLTSPSLPPWSLLWWQWLLSCVCWWLSVGVTCPTRTRGRRETCQTFPLLLELLLGSPYGASRCLMSLALKEIRRVEGPMRFPGRAEVGFVANFSEDMESLIGAEDVSLDVTSSAEPNCIIAGVASSSSTSSLRSTFAQIFLADRVVQSRP